MKVRYGKCPRWWLQHKTNTYRHNVAVYYIIYKWETTLDTFLLLILQSEGAALLLMVKIFFPSLALWSSIFKGQSMFRDLVSTGIESGIETVDLLSVDFPPGIPNLCLGDSLS